MRYVSQRATVGGSAGFVRSHVIGDMRKISEVCTMQSTNIKQEAHHLVEQLPDNATWDDLAYEIYIRQAIEAGVIESNAGRLLDVKEGK
jgi:hypothetical protein